jgi:uncharacterized membrane protein YbhN (UPF0104 family)
MRLNKKFEYLIFISIIFAFVYYFQKNSSYIYNLEFNFVFLFFVITIHSLKFLNQSLINFYLYRNVEIALSLSESIQMTIMNSLGNSLGPLKLGLGVKIAYLNKKHSLKVAKFFEINAQYGAFYFFGSTLIFLFILLIFQNDYIMEITLITIIFIVLGLLSRNLVKVFSKYLETRDNNNFIVKFFSIINLKSIKKYRISLSVLSLIQLFLSISLVFFIFQFLFLENTFLDSIYINFISQISSLISLTPGNVGVLEIILVFFKDLYSMSANDVILLSLTTRFSNLVSILLINTSLNLIEKIKN